MTRAERAPDKSKERRKAKNATSAARSERRKARDLPERLQERSVFTQILDRLVRLSPGAVGAALADREGECVDYAGFVDPFEIKVAAAHWQIVLTTVALEQPGLGDVRQITVHEATWCESSPTNTRWCWCCIGTPRSRHRRARSKRPTPDSDAKPAGLRGKTPPRGATSTSKRNPTTDAGRSKCSTPGPGARSR
jgi:hypothetical protein